MNMHYPGIERLLRQFELEEQAMEAIKEHFNPSSLEEANMRTILKELLKSEFNPIGKDLLTTVKGTIDVAANIEKWVSFVKDFYAIFQPGLGTTGAMASVGTVGFGFALIGPFMMFWGFCIKLVEARSNAEEYEAIATAFTVTAWAFGDNYPTESKDWWKQKKGALAPIAGHLDKQELDKAWKKAKKNTLVGLKQLASRSSIASKKKMSPGDAEECLKIGMKLAGRQNLCNAVLRSLAKAARKEGKPHLATAIEGAAGIYTDASGTIQESSTGAPIKYPKN